MINYITKKPNILFLIDSIGAIGTAFLLFVILRNYNEHYGMPEAALIYLSVIAVLFCIYSITCFFFLIENWAPFLSFIAYANLAYCVLTIGLVIANYATLTVLGVTYFLIEILVICGLVYIELNVATAIKQDSIK